MIIFRVVLTAMLAAVMACALSSKERAVGLDTLSEDGVAVQRVLYLGDCSYRVVAKGTHGYDLFEVERRRFGEYYEWSYGDFVGSGPIYFPVPYGGQKEWEVAGVVFHLEPLSIDGWMDVYAVYVKSWGEGIRFIYTKDGDYIGVFDSEGKRVVGIADRNKVRLF